MITWSCWYSTTLCDSEFSGQCRPEHMFIYVFVIAGWRLCVGQLWSGLSWRRSWTCLRCVSLTLPRFIVDIALWWSRSGQKIVPTKPQKPTLYKWERKISTLWVITGWPSSSRVMGYTPTKQDMETLILACVLIYRYVFCGESKLNLLHK